MSELKNVVKIAPIFSSIIVDGTVSEWKRILDVNVIALSICSREAVKSMNSRNLEDAHIIHLSRLVYNIKKMKKNH